MAERKDNKGRKLRTGEHQRKDGRYQYKYKGNDKQVHVIYSWRLTPKDKIDKNDTSKSLRELEDELNEQIVLGLNDSNCKITTYEMMKKYLSLKPNLSLSTSYNYEKICENIIKKYTVLADMKIVDVKKSDILGFYTYLSQKKGYRNTTIQLIQNVVYPTFQLAFDDGHIRKNPCVGCMKDFPLNDAKEKYALTEEQEETFLKFVKNNPIYNRYYPMMLLVLETGMRCGEFIGLTWDDINYREGYIDVNHQLQYKKYEGKYTHLITELKTKASYRKIPINIKILEALKLQKEQQMLHGVNSLEEKSIFIEGYKIRGRNNLIFTTFKGTPFKGITINRVLNGIIRDFNYSELNIANTNGREPKLLPHLSVHILRHTACTQMARMGMDVKVLQYIMGHTNINITMEVYNHVDMERVKKESKRVFDLQNNPNEIESDAALLLDTSQLFMGNVLKTPTIEMKNIYG